jgi:trehalose/maltose hydrolase-like predicted phosphorylase
VSAWLLEFDGFDPSQEGLREALCTLGNGYLATRGALPEARADDVHYPGTYVAGVYNRLTTTVAGHTVEDESIVNLPNWLPLTFRVEDGCWLEAAELLENRTELDLRRGVLTRLARVRDDSGRLTRLSQRRLVSMDDRTWPPSRRRSCPKTGPAGSSSARWSTGTSRTRGLPATAHLRATT